MTRPIIAGTGHRPAKLGGYSSTIFDRLCRFAKSELETLSPSLVISGMAQGWDQALAIAAIQLSIPFDAHIPCSNQESRWPPDAQTLYRQILARARHTITISPHYTSSCMQDRNVSMVNACTHVLALYDGSSGGTANCVRYAQLLKRPIINCWSRYQSLPY